MKKIIVTVLCLLFCVYFIYSQDSLKVISLSSIEVTGYRPSVNTPITQKTINSIDVTKQSYGQEMVYIIDKTPSITSQSDGGQPNGYVSFRLRGIDQTRINMTLNGVPLNEPEDQGVYFSNYPNFSNNIKSLQIQRGVGSSSNGTSSYGGSINFESKNGLEKGGDLNISDGSFNTKSINTSYSTGLLNDKLSMFGNVSYYDSDGYKYHSGGSGYSAFVSGCYYGLNNVIKLTAFTGKSLNDMAWYAVSEDDIKKDPKTNYNLEGEKDNFKQSFVQLQHNYTFNKKSVLTNTLYYNRLDGDWGMFINESDLLNFKLGSNFVGFMSNYFINYHKLKTNIGVHINNYERVHGGSIENNILYSNKGVKSEISCYLKNEYKLNNFTFFSDFQLRKIQFKYTGDSIMEPISWTFFNPRVGINYNINKNNKFYISVGKSNREPTRTDLFKGNDNFSPLNSSTIKSESVVDYELGYVLNNDKLYVQSNLFYMDFKNEITLLGAVGLNSLPLMASVDKSCRYGLEFDMSYKLNKNLSINNNTTFMNSEIKGDGVTYHQLYTPKVIVNQNIEYDYNNKISVIISGRYLSSSYINPANTEIIPSYTLFNLKVGYYITNNISLSIQGNNLMSIKYYTGGYVYDNNNCYFVGSPFSLYTTLNVKF